MVVSNFVSFKFQITSGSVPSEYEGEFNGEEIDDSVQPLGSVPSWNVLTVEEDGCTCVPTCQGSGEGKRWC